MTHQAPTGHEAAAMVYGPTAERASAERMDEATANVLQGADWPDQDCRHGHYHCAAFEGGACIAEAIAAEYGRLERAEATAAAVTERLEELRTELRAERISYGELIELQGLGEAGMIPEGDVELREAAGLPEFPED